jgi:thiamine-phosphate pyrophosphorylase
MKSFLRVLLSLDVFFLGLLLIMVPWMSYWDHNYFIDKYPGLIPIVLHPSVRGAVTGLGWVDVFLASRILRGRKPILCYVTDRCSLEGARGSSAPLAGVAGSPGVRLLQESIRNAVTAGAGWIQIREKDLEGSALIELARIAVAQTRSASARVLINDRLDVALAANAAGVHLGEKSMPLEAVAAWRRSAGRRDFLIGVSTHSLESALAAERGGADYIFFGPVFETPSKAEYGAPQGIARLREVCAAVNIPVLAIGGVNSKNTRECLKAGAAGVAAIRMFQSQGTLNS